VAVAAGAPYAAFLRGMNVGGHRLSNAELRAHVTALGFLDVATFRASGNVVFNAADTGSGVRAAEAIRETIEQGLEAALGYAVPSFIRAGDEVCKIAAREPFPSDAVSASAGKLQVSLLFALPSPATQRAVLELAAGEDDRLAFGVRELYWLPSGGMLDSALDLKAIERLLGPMTMRTMGTIEQIAGRYFAG
jgi:uncharacterized protein (DUF1697 family)